MDHDQCVESVRDCRHVRVDLDKLIVFRQPFDDRGRWLPRRLITEQAQAVYDADLGLARLGEAQDHPCQIVFEVALARGRERRDGFDLIDGISGNYTDITLLTRTAEVETLEVVAN